jgi:hypothetical protein
MVRWLPRIALTVCVVVVLLVLAGASYQAIESRLDARRFPEGGRLVDVGGYRLMLNCTGVGSPTVILEAGFGDVSVEWKSVQPEIARFSRVCSYDRAVDLGVGRLMLRAQGADQGAYLILQRKYLRARASELQQMRVSAGQARAADHISDKPLVVLTAAENTDSILSSGLSQHDFEEFQRIWVDDLQMRLARLSTRGRRIMVQGSGHDIPSDRPGYIVTAVHELCTEATASH